ncbi:MAG TPA: hypothetical protein PLE45_10210 [Spirochaetota bacterium]|nr:hypothetical protein [Spirochaetota bacterium]HOL56578.1 hypothetical protein [Spirochaetota bacterium]HPP04979.1 hypothetical protein [Spirochaetota bacterium]
MGKDILSQKEINDLKIDESISLDQNIKNLIILCKNELTILEETLIKYSEKSKKSIFKKINKILLKLINIRK